MIFEFPNYVELDFVEEIKNKSRKYINFSSNHGSYNREGHTVDITAVEDLKELDHKIHQLMKGIQETIVATRYKPQHSSADSGYEYHAYNPGQRCYLHSDGETQNEFLRYASVIIQLSDNKEGGELIFPNQNKTIKSEAGKLIVFPPYGGYAHYVTPSTTMREVLVAWFIYKDIRINNVE